MSKEVMMVLNPQTGAMECKVCGARHIANIQPGGGYSREAMKCKNGCKLPKARRRK